MNRIASLGIALWLAATAVLPAQDGRFLRIFPLDDRTPYQLPIAVRQGMTTLLFPTPPQNYAASRVAFVEAGQQVADYSADERIDFILLTHKGSAYCSLRALRPNAQDTLSVFLDGKVYQLFLRADEDHPLYTVQFVSGAGYVNGRTDAVSPNRLVDCLTKAKAYPVLAKYYPERLDDVTYARPARIITYTDFRVLIDEVFGSTPRTRWSSASSWRTGPTAKSITSRNSLRSGSATSSSTPPSSMPRGVMPPRAVVPAYFAITGTPGGGRNELDPARNAFTVLVPRVFPPEPPPLPASPAMPTISIDAPPLPPAKAAPHQPTPRQPGPFRPARTK